ncbi:N-acetylneuraminate synthase [Millionella massiliensis]|uniref:N-acetylneuraminate synthase n=1 Tax=Millionella massiliensis TaxID=1871023 RepID=UPI0008D93461|nr:N-acetylneuraminate synthase [Millionella massiliensis]
MSGQTLIIAEAGVNHNGSLDQARKLIDAAAAAGVDYVKFQTFRAEKLVTQAARQAEYQSRNIGSEDQSQYRMLKALELSEEDHLQLIDHCRQCGVHFLSTAFDLDSIAFLDTLALPLWKIPSGEITNFPYLRAIGRSGKPVILSTGMASLDEVGQAIEVLTRFGTPREQITLLHCTTEYPAPKDQINLRAMQTLYRHFGLPAGYSDHTQGIEIPVAAVAMGATVIEKHFTLDRNLPGPDHKASLEPDELAEMVRQIRNIEAALGNGVKEPSEAEKPNIPVARKSIVAARPITRGELLTEENLTAKRPGNGISPMLWETVVGQRAVRDFATDEAIELV